MAETTATLAKAWSRDRYLAALFAPDDLRPHLFNLFAFAAEIERIPKLVSEPQLGEIRLQWWLDTLEAITRREAIDHPVAQAFAGTIHAFNLPTEHLENFVEAHRADIYADQFPNLFSLESYIAETDAALMQFAAIILDRPAAKGSSSMIGLAGTAFGLARLLSRTQLEDKFIPPGETVASLKAKALQHLNEAREHQIPQSLLPAVLPASLIELYLNGSTSQLRSQWRMWRVARSGRL
jgi:15-cis-phytoene synthase